MYTDTTTCHGSCTNGYYQTGTVGDGSDTCSLCSAHITGCALCTVNTACT